MLFILSVVILKLKIDGNAGICANLNIDFQIAHALSFPKYAILDELLFLDIVNLTKSNILVYKFNT